MFAKSLILILLGSSIILVNSLPGEPTSNTSEANNATEIIKDGYNYLVEKGQEVIKKAADSIKTEKELWEKQFKEKSTKGNLQTVALKVKDLKKQAEEAIFKKVQEVQETWQNWKEGVKGEYEKKNEEKY